jgi:hypothetical protein
LARSCQSAAIRAFSDAPNGGCVVCGVGIDVDVDEEALVAVRRGSTAMMSTAMRRAKRSTVVMPRRLIAPD